MAFWFDKNELRRFSRIDMPVKIFITSAAPIVDKEIFALGIDYFPNSVNKKIRQNHQQLLHWVNHIQEQKEILQPVFLQVIDSAEILGEAVKQISLGKNPLLDESFSQQIMNNLKSIGRIKTLEEPAPKTFQYFLEVEKKLTHFYRLLLVTLHRSTSKSYHCFEPITEPFKIDEMTQKFSQPSFHKIPLVQSINYMHKLVDNFCAVFQEMNLDYYLRENPQAWKVQDVRISAGGFSALYQKRFLPGRPLKSYICLSESGRIMTVKSTLARCATNVQKKGEHNAFYFEFPDPQDQKYLELEIERRQLEKVTGLCTLYQFQISNGLI